GLEALADIEEELEPLDRLRRGHLEPDVDEPPLELALVLDFGGRAHLDRAGDGQSERNEDGERRSERRQLRPAGRERGDQPETGEDDVDAELPGRRAGHLGTGCSTAGVGTRSRTSRT